MTAVFVSSVAFAGVPSLASAQIGFGTRPTAGVFGGVTFPRGDLSDVVGTGWHAGALAKMRVFRAFDLRLDGTYAKFGKKDEINGGNSAFFDTDAKITFGTVSAVLNLGADSAAYPGDNTVSPYLVGGLGGYRLDFNSNCSGTCAGIQALDVTTDLGLNIGFGATVPLAGIRTFAEGRFHRILRSDDDGGAATMFLLSVGVKFR